MKIDREKMILATIKCPRCGDTRVVKIPYDRFMANEQGGLLKIAFNHVDHIFVVWIDSSGTQRAAEVYDNIENLTSKHREDAISLSDLINFLGKRSLAKILAGTVAGYKVFLELDRKSMRVIDFLLTFFLKEFPTIVNKKEEAEVIIDNFQEKGDKVPGEGYFLDVLDTIEKINDRKMQYTKLQISVDKVREQTEFLRDELLRKGGTVSIIQIKKILRIDDNELLAIIVNRLVRRYPKMGEKIREKRYFLLS